MTVRRAEEASECQQMMAYGAIQPGTSWVTITRALNPAEHCRLTTIEPIVRIRKGQCIMCQIRWTTSRLRNAVVGQFNPLPEKRRDCVPIGLGV